MTNPSKEGNAAADITKRLQDRIALYELQLQIARIIGEQIKVFEGKTISKRLATAVEKEIHARMGAEWTVYYRPQYGMFHLSIWRSEPPLNYDHRMESLIAYDSDPVIRYAAWADRNQCYLLNEKRIPKMVAALNAGKPAEWATIAAEAQAKLDAVDADMSSAECSYLFKTDRR